MKKDFKASVLIIQFVCLISNLTFLLLNGKVLLLYTKLRDELSRKMIGTFARSIDCVVEFINVTFSVTYPCLSDNKEPIN